MQQTIPNTIIDIPVTPATQTGRVAAISISTRKGTPKKNVQTARLIENHGIEGDAHAGNWHRQISLLANESIDKMREKLASLRAGAFAENITTENIDIAHLPIGSRVKIGMVEMEITQIGKECHDTCAIFAIVGDCVMPREGIFARVLRSGEISVGDKIEVWEQHA